MTADVFDPRDQHTWAATLSVAQAAEVLGIGRNAAFVAAKGGELPTLRLGRCVRVPRARLLAMLGESDHLTSGQDQAAESVVPQGDKRNEAQTVRGPDALAVVMFNRGVHVPDGTERGP
jgi:excisionase family DNA binding protein